MRGCAKVDKKLNPFETKTPQIVIWIFGDIDVQPKDIVKFQSDIGVDIATMLDLFTTPDRSEKTAMDHINAEAEFGRIGAGLNDETSERLAARPGTTRGRSARRSPWPPA